MFLLKTFIAENKIIDNEDDSNRIANGFDGYGFSRPVIESSLTGFDSFLVNKLWSSFDFIG